MQFSNKNLSFGHKGKKISFDNDDFLPATKSVDNTFLPKIIQISRFLIPLKIDDSILKESVLNRYTLRYNPFRILNSTDKT